MEAVFLLSFLFLVGFLGYFSLFLLFRNKIFTVDSSSRSPTILVLGAGLENDGKPSDILKDRLLTTIELIRNTHPDQVILSGSQTYKSGSESEAMFNFVSNRIYCINMIICDNFGKSTYDSIKNMLNGSIAEPVTIISQRFHLTRALLISKILGLKCTGVAANNYKFSLLNNSYWYVREIFATPFNVGKIIFDKLFSKFRKITAII